jgi:hypothetical protein
MPVIINNVQEVTDDFLRRVAHIMGSSSAAERALADRDRRRGLGENVVILWDSARGVLLVGPPVEEPRP